MAGVSFPGEEKVSGRASLNFEGASTNSVPSQAILKYWNEIDAFHRQIELTEGNEPWVF